MGQDVTTMGSAVTSVGCANQHQERALKKHTATIHCTNTLSLLQRKISNALLYHAYPKLMQEEEHAITVRELCQLIGYQGHNIAAIKSALKGLISTIIEWNLTQDAIGENWTASAILASVSLQGPICYYAYSPRMKQLLHSPSLFGKIDLVIQSRFRSSYGLALYENCIRYRGLPRTKWFDLSLFRKLMGVPEAQYPIFRDFKRRVLDKAIDEVNAYADLTVESEYGKEKRKVVKVRFKLKNTTRHYLRSPSQLVNDAQDYLKQQLKQFGFSSIQTRKLLSEYTIDYILGKIKMIASSKPYQAGLIKNKAGYLMKALQEDYQTPSTVGGGCHPLHEVMVKHTENEIEQQYNRYREKYIQEKLNTLSNDDYVKLIRDFEEYAKSAIHSVLALQGHRYTKTSIMQSPQVLALFRKFVVETLKIHIMSRDEFKVTLTTSTS